MLRALTWLLVQQLLRWLIGHRAEGMPQADRRQNQITASILRHTAGELEQGSHAAGPSRLSQQAEVTSAGTAGTQCCAPLQNWGQAESVTLRVAAPETQNSPDRGQFGRRGQFWCQRVRAASAVRAIQRHRNPETKQPERLAISSSPPQWPQQVLRPLGWISFL